ncbi:hypothetical protein F7P69_06125 [Cellulosimicrobium funkei]|nr:hypothetical protein [Cellulosimicrobium funkei]
MPSRPESRKGTVPPARMLAILAGGLALGVASGVTVAAWHDPETATTTFTAGTFETQSVGPDGEWSHHGPGAGVPLTEDLTDLAPGGTYEAPSAGESHYGGLRVRTTPGSTRGGMVQLTEMGAEGALAGALEYRVVARQTESSPCTAADFDDDAVFLAGGPSSYQPFGSGTSDTTAEIGADGQDPLDVCLDLRVAAPAGGDTGESVQGTSTQVGLGVTITQL